ncbi:hypothetical protein SAMN05428995_105282 [Loktanella sp. DSM 29012]|uniref:DUF2218 domain-containing protein n=1 Tax=Loktanella sp. DSM 29012 TaxID=1881056 RepID=UPI0008B95295|nr:DUF2218 domain-containing protein [Loktanella sp. DSM 29012]SEQ60746.1 hypothetical protein SAMN05428995_105282 [Loktanella sp. DSM 29012]
MQPAFRDEGHFDTTQASRYLQQLSKHFAHKAEVRFGPASAEIALPPGNVALTATDDVLRVVVTTDDPEKLDRMRGIVDSHLARFAFREAFSAMAWATETGGAAS